MKQRQQHIVDDTDDLRPALRDHSREVAEFLLGPANEKYSTKTQLRFGKGKGSLSVEIGRRNPGTWFNHSTGTGSDMFGLIRHVKGCDFVEAKEIARQIVGGTAPVAPQATPQPALASQQLSGTQKFGAMLWYQSVDPGGTMVETYLRSRSLDIPEGVANEVIRYHRPFWCRGRKVAAMVALFRNVLTNNPCAVSVTFLDKNAKKIERRFFGPIKDAAIKFAAATDELNIGEGIESTLSGMAMGYAPAWACGSAGGIANLAVIGGIKTLRVFGEKNDGGANRNAVQTLALRWNETGAGIYVIEPEIGDDLNDDLCSSEVA
jgi:hypothetical protein